MKPKSDRYRIAVTVISCHVTLISILTLLLIADALLMEEFTPLLTLLAPVTGIYAGSVFRYLSDSIRGNPDNSEETPLPHADLVRRLVLGHFLAMLFLILAKSAFNWINFSTMTILMTLLETSFGVYMGMVMSAVFGER